MGILYTLPFYGQNKITSAYGNRTVNGKKEFHCGWDVVGVDDTDVRAACPGDIKSSTMITDHNDLTWQWGNYVKVRDALKDDLFACHMASRAVAVGNAVNTGDKLGVMGSTGYSFGEHTHWEARTAAGVTVCPGELFGLPNTAGVTWDREAMEAAVIGYLDCTVAQYRWRKGAGTEYSLYQPSNIGKSIYCRAGVRYRVYATAKDAAEQMWCQITPPANCATAGSPPMLWVSAACGTHTAKAMPAEPEGNGGTGHKAVDWSSTCNEFVVSVTGADRNKLRDLCERLQLHVENLRVS